MRKKILLPIILLLCLTITGCGNNNYYGCYENDKSVICLYNENKTDYFAGYEQSNGVEQLKFTNNIGYYCYNELFGYDERCFETGGIEKNLVTTYNKSISGYLNISNNTFIFSDSTDTAGQCSIKNNSLNCKINGKNYNFNKNENDISFYQESGGAYENDDSLINKEEYNNWVQENTTCLKGLGRFNIFDGDTLLDTVEYAKKVMVNPDAEGCITYIKGLPAKFVLTKNNSVIYEDIKELKELKPTN